MSNKPEVPSMDREALNPILDELKIGLRQLYGPRLKHLILYGSWARNMATEDSDIDIMVVLDGDVSPGDEIRRMGDIVYEINLKYCTLVTVFPTSDANYRDARSPLYLNVRREGVPA